MTDRERAGVPHLWFPADAMTQVDVWRALLLGSLNDPPTRGAARMRAWAAALARALRWRR